MSVFHAVAVCMLTFHGPDGSEFLVVSDTIKAIRPVEAHHHGHLTTGTNALIYLGIRPNGFGIHETPEEALQIIRDCEELARKHP
jgi:hypothetical protein